VSHHTALEILGLIDEPCEAVHLTIVRSLRRSAPPGVALHTALNFPPPEHISEVRGLPVTRAARSIADAWNGEASKGVILEAARRALKRRLTTSTELIFICQERPGTLINLIRRATSEGALDLSN